MTRPQPLAWLAALMLANVAPAFAADSRSATVPAAPQAVRAATSVGAARAFTYQGMLRSAGVPLNSTADLQFTLWDAPSSGTNFGTQTVTTTVSSGLFTVTLNDAGQFAAAAFDGRALWLSVNVRSPAGTGYFTTLDPRQAITPAPLASTLAAHALVENDSTSGNAPALDVFAKTGNTSDPVALRGLAGNPGEAVTFPLPVGVTGQSPTGYGVLGVTHSGSAVTGFAFGSGRAGYFEGDVYLNGRLEVTRWRSQVAINAVGPLPRSSSTIYTQGGTLLLTYSGSGYSSVSGSQIGMGIYLDGVLVDNTGILANNASEHLAFVPKTWVVSGIPGGAHVISLARMNTITQTDSGDIFNVSVTELPF